ncbi:hypothetical protein M0R45_035223 [Rubus argutus]|uniref:Uncharacterized protein n=1 Tax=Rubus argutus TaxID=59490 RepID=A0AAW1VW58_RUBAR
MQERGSCEDLRDGTSEARQRRGVHGGTGSEEDAEAHDRGDLAVRVNGGSVGWGRRRQQMKDDSGDQQCQRWSEKEHEFDWSRVGVKVCGCVGHEDLLGRNCDSGQRSLGSRILNVGLVIGIGEVGEGCDGGCRNWVEISNARLLLFEGEGEGQI